MRYEWGVRKAAANVQKHGVTFDSAREVFTDPFRTVRLDAREEYGEERWSTIGAVQGRYLVVAYTETEDTRRLISARKANRHERERYHRAR
ncbi:MAG: hypothetical protein CMN66_11020 [Sphingomonadaceae bacterium]|nr:hypothetical protein [Sphingomonadaceae bacterium]